MQILSYMKRAYFSEISNICKNVKKKKKKENIQMLRTKYIWYEFGCGFTLNLKMRIAVVSDGSRNINIFFLLLLTLF